jgi:hypothetical protein
MEVWQEKMGAAKPEELVAETPRLVRTPLCPLKVALLMWSESFSAQRSLKTSR